MKSKKLKNSKAKNKTKKHKLKGGSYGASGIELQDFVLKARDIDSIINEFTQLANNLSNYKKIQLPAIKVLDGKEALVNAIFKGLENNNTVEELDLNSNNIGNEGALILANTLSQNKKITTLNLIFNEIGDEGAIALANALKTNTTLKVLYLSQNKIGNEGLNALIQLLENNKTLTIKFYNNTKPKVENNDAYNKSLNNLYQVQEINANLNNPEVKIKKTNINGIVYYIDDYGAQLLAKELLNNTKITTLNLIFNEIGDPGAIALADALAQNTTLKVLDLSQNKIGSKGLNALTQLLEKNKTLDIEFRNNTKPEGDVELSYNKSLNDLYQVKTINEKLNLNNSEVNIIKTSIKGIFYYIDDYGAQLLAKELLNNNTKITTLDLTLNEIGDAGAIALANALYTNKTLKVLNLSQNKIGILGANALLNVLQSKQNNVLEQLKLNNNVKNDNMYNIIDMIDGILPKNNPSPIINENAIITQKTNALPLFTPLLTTLSKKTKVKEVKKVTEAIAFIKKKINEETSDETSDETSVETSVESSNTKTNNNYFDSKVKTLFNSESVFNDLVETNYTEGIKQIKTLPLLNDTNQKLAISLHGTIRPNFFKLPNNVNVVFMSPVSYVSCSPENALLNYLNDPDNLNNFLNNPSCFNKNRVGSLFNQSVIYYGGQYCIDLLMGRGKPGEEGLSGPESSTGINIYDSKIKKFIVKSKKTYNENYIGTYDDGYSEEEKKAFKNLGIPIVPNLSYAKFPSNINKGIVSTERSKPGDENAVLSNFVKHFFSNNNNNTKQFTIFFTSCRELGDQSNKDILSFYEKIIKYLNFKI